MLQYYMGDTVDGDMVPEAALEAERDVRAHIRQLFLDQLQKTAGTNARHRDGRGEGGGGARPGGREGEREALKLRMLLCVATTACLPTHTTAETHPVVF